MSTSSLSGDTSSGKGTKCMNQQALKPNPITPITIKPDHSCPGLVPGEFRHVLDYITQHPNVTLYDFSKIIVSYNQLPKNSQKAVHTYAKEVNKTVMAKKSAKKAVAKKK